MRSRAAIAFLCCALASGTAVAQEPAAEMPPPPPPVATGTPPPPPPSPFPPNDPGPPTWGYASPPPRVPWPDAYPARTSRTDPMLAAGIAMTAIGAVFGIWGGTMLGEENQSQICGVGGCAVVSIRDPETTARARGLVASGIALGAVGVPAIVVGASGKTPAVGARRSERGLVFGTWMMGFGAGAAAFALAFAADPNPQQRVRGGGGVAGVGIVGGAMLAVGAPLAIAGAAHTDGGDATPKQIRSEGRMITGMAMSSVGAAGFAAGTVAFATFADHGGELGGLEAIFVGGPPMLCGLALLGVGIPLWASGAGEAPEAPLRPVMRAGPGSMALDWRF